MVEPKQIQDFMKSAKSKVKSGGFHNEICPVKPFQPSQCIHI